VVHPGPASYIAGPQEQTGEDLVRNRLISWFTLGALLGVFASEVRAETITIEAGRDATLIEDAGGSRANGSGPVLFSGRTSQAQDGVRRALLWFDIATVLPADAVIQDVTLVLTMVGGNPPVGPVRLHRLLDDWGEGASSASGGGGADAEPGDATWLHTFHEDRFWAISGGQFVGRETAVRPVGVAGIYTWNNAPGLERDVRRWLAAPHRNFGWILIGDETAPQTAKRFASRNHSDPSFRPVLEVTFSRRTGLKDSRSRNR
jgi:hypothetical protein